MLALPFLLPELADENGLVAVGGDLRPQRLIQAYRLGIFPWYPAGGLYGVAIGGLFAGESMFTRRRDASKVALAHVVRRLGERGFQLFDIQLLSEHTARLGAVEIPRTEYLARLRRALVHSPRFSE